MDACKRVVDDVRVKLGSSVTSMDDVTEVAPDLGPITFCDHYLLELL
ncbi:hypothetical protein A2U01_0068949, partial [Trifolium medium]|nr:hypothetical protein [Trifolium medium]